MLHTYPVLSSCYSFESYMQQKCFQLDLLVATKARVAVTAHMHPPTLPCTAQTICNELPPMCTPAARCKECLCFSRELLPGMSETLLLAPTYYGSSPRDNSSHLLHILGLTQDVLGARQHSRAVLHPLPALLPWK